jgi:phosphoribosyl 1,2-cyclic phosphodiesterase
VRLTFLGTGAAGGTPGDGRSARRESSLLLEAGAGVLIDATRHLESQLADVDRLDAVLLTHAHRDASGGIPALRRWWRERDLAPLPLYAAPQAIAVLEARHRRLDHLELVAVEPGRRRERSGLAFEAVEVPHARDRRYRTFAWRVEDAGRAVVYASDVARLEPGSSASCAARGSWLSTAPCGSARCSRT